MKERNAMTVDTNRIIHHRILESNNSIKSSIGIFAPWNTTESDKRKLILDVMVSTISFPVNK